MGNNPHLWRAKRIWSCAFRLKNRFLRSLVKWAAPTDLPIDDNVLCGWLPGCKDFLKGWRFGRVQSCVRPVDAVYMTAGLDGFRGLGPTLLCGL